MGGSGAGGMSAGAGGGSSGTAGMAGSGTSGAGGGSSGSAGAGTSGSGGGSGDGGAAGNAGDVDAGQDAGDDDAGALPFTLSSPAFDNNAGCGPDGAAAGNCDFFPVENTGLGDGPANISPEFNWVGAPAGTQSFAIAMHDLSFLQGGDPFTHWVMWNIPATETGLPANLPAGTAPGVPDDETGQVSFRPNEGFAGSGACGNVYEFVLFALSVPSFDPESTDQNDVEEELEELDGVIATTTMRARSNPAGPCNQAP